MKKKTRVISILAAVCVLLTGSGGANVYAGVSAAGFTYTKDKVYDANEKYIKKQPSSYSYNGYSVLPLEDCDTYLSEHGIGEGYAFFTGRNVATGDKIVIEFNTPVDSRKFEAVTISMKQVPGNSYNAYNATDNILSTVRKSFGFKTYGVEKISFLTTQFADSKGFVKAIILKNTKAETAGQLFIDAFSVGTPAEESDGGNTGDNTGDGGNTGSAVDTKNQYDATKENLVVQTSDKYKNLTIHPFTSSSTYLSGVGVGEGYALSTRENVKQGDIMIMEFTTPIDSRKADIITISLKQTPGNGYEVYKASEATLSKAVKSFDVGSYDIERVALRTALFADSDGLVRAIILKSVRADTPGQLFIDGYSLGSDPYARGVEYDVEENYVKLQSATDYKGVKVVPFTERTTFWTKEAKVDSDTGYGLTANKPEGSKLIKGDVMILEFVTDISAEKFEVLNLSLAVSSQKGAAFEVYNVNEIKNGKLGEAKQKVSADFWSFKINNIALAPLADEDGYVSAIALKLVSDEAATFTVGGFSLATLESLVDRNAPDIQDNKISVLETDTSYDFSIEFNKTGSALGNADEKTLGDMIALNGVKLSEINKEKTYVKVSWQIMGRYCLNISVDKAYDGAGAVINTDRLLVGNCIELEEGMDIPNGDKLSDTFALHVYSVDSITEVTDEDREYAAAEVNSISSSIDENENLVIQVKFSNQITGTPMYFVCNPASFNRKDVAALNGDILFYEENMAKAFIYGGYKSSILDHLKINGNSIGEWLAIDELSGSTAYQTAVMVHYGQAGDNIVTVYVSSAATIYQEIKQDYSDGTLKVSFDRGLKFASGKEVKETVTYGYDGNVWSRISQDDFTVYYDGRKVEDKDRITIKGSVSAGNIAITGSETYSVEEKRSGNTVEYSIRGNEEELLRFTVEETALPDHEDSISEEKDFLIYIISIAAAAVVLITAAGIAAFAIRRRKKNVG